MILLPSKALLRREVSFSDLEIIVDLGLVLFGGGPFISAPE